MRRLVFEPSAFQDFTAWATQDKRVFRRIVTLLKDIQRSPFQGIGKPEPLKHNLSGYWSRRITQEHRLVYKITNDELIIISCRYHYK